MKSHIILSLLLFSADGPGVLGGEIIEFFLPERFVPEERGTGMGACPGGSAKRTGGRRINATRGRRKRSFR